VVSTLVVLGSEPVFGRSASGAGLPASIDIVGVSSLFAS
jgi:hypothetical protein